MENYITIDNGFDDVKKKNFFAYSFVYSFVWMCFHFTLIFFFLIQLRSPLNVWIFLWLWNLIAFFSDSPIWVFQKYFPPKKIFLFWAYLMLVVSIIFVYLIYQTDSLHLNELSLEFSVEAFRAIFWSFFNIFLLLLSVSLYWIIKELSDVTSYSYIMNNSDPSEYSTMFSKKNIYSWLWSLVWLITSWVILAFNSFIAVIILTIFIIWFIFFINKYFDRSDNEVGFYDLNIIKLISKENIFNSAKEFKTKIIQNKNDYIEKTKNIKVLFLKPIELKNSIDFKEVYETTLKDLHNFFKILFEPPYNYRLLIMWGIFALFWFWDTFVTSFLIDFIDWILVKNSQELEAFNLRNIFTAYVFIALLAIPAYSTQIPFINLWKKIWNLKLILTWTIVSGISILMFWMFDALIIILFLWLINSLWYAASMPTSQWEFSIEYNNTYAKKKKLKTIDANASSAPIKMVANLANVCWFIIWWLLIQMFGYTWTFFVFWSILIWVSILSILKQEDYKL